MKRETSTETQLAMAKKSSLQQWWHWLMGFFFTNGTTPTDRELTDLQRRACWVGVAMAFQFGNETLRVVSQMIENQYQNTVILVDPVSTILLIVLISGSFVALWFAFRPAPARQSHKQGTPIWQRWVCGLCLFLSLVGAGACTISIVRCFLPVQFANDGTVLDTNAAVHLLQGEDPYANPSLSNLNLGNLMQNISLYAEWTTPLRMGSFAGKLEYPNNDELTAALQKGIKTMHAQEFETKVSYPAFSFLSLVPFALLNYINVLPLYILCHFALIIAAWYYARPEMRPWILLLAFANVSTWTTTVGETLDMLYMSLLTLAWLTSHRRWLSILLLGLAIASKQTAWFFMPFYAIMVYWQYGIKESLLRVTTTLSIGVLINLPFILWGPHDWLAGVMAPLVDPMFPMGTGIIALSTGHIIPYLSTRFYQVLEYSTYLLTIVYYWFRCRRAPEAAMLLAVIFLFFAWRSLPSYFYCSAFPLLVLLLKKPVDQRRQTITAASDPNGEELSHGTVKSTATLSYR